MPEPTQETIREQVLQAVFDHLAALREADEFAGLEIERNRRQPVKSLPSLIQIDGGDASDDSQWGKEEHRLGVTIAAYAGDEALADAIAARLHQRLAADTTLGGLAVDCRAVTTDADYSDGAGQAKVCVALREYEITYWTKPGDPFTAAP